MSKVVLDSSVIEILRVHPNGVRVCDESGHEVGVFFPSQADSEVPATLTPEIAGELVRRMTQKDIKWSTTAEMIARIKARAAEQ